MYVICIIFLVLAVGTLVLNLWLKWDPSCNLSIVGLVAVGLGNFMVFRYLLKGCS
ncbi:hypothetical protein MPK71_gp026 [Erwinia phage pEa_SNUABM_1]|uniref:Uncharacterized protein n=1 Tax=Erwinia phage pEa_SNUABM_1 TaxID=2869543 RepID=A0AAE8BZI8_9CAUD|nr:hypothetical protein MPK71_gp026 [Erwinia phage pEa_SNUABM_1]QZE57235.1 hypothetical protein pEaSNUABM1_00026 [Erwinia phage pEa_SNUABM_1]